MGGAIGAVVSAVGAKKAVNRVSGGRGIGGLVGDITGSNRAAEQQAAAAQGAAQAEQQAREASAAEQLGFRGESIAEARGFTERLARASQSPGELRALESGLQFQEKDIARSEKLLSSIDPAILEASQQVLKLLRGEEAGTTNVVRGQRDRQRKQLVDRLRGQLGPGAENSSAGIQALNQFDTQTSDLIAQNQQSSIGQLTNVSQGFVGQRGDISSRGIAGLLGVGQGFGARSARQTGALATGFGFQQQARLTGDANVGSARAGAAGVAGAQFVGQQLLGQQAQANAGFVKDLGLAVAGGAASGFTGKK